MGLARALPLGAPIAALLLSTSLSGQTATQYFTPAQPIVELNAGGDAFSPTLTEDELYMVFASTRAGGFGGYDLYETNRANVDDPWSPPVNLSVLNSVSTDYEPNLSYDGLELYFISTRAGGIGPSDIYVSQRPAPAAPWGPPINIGSPVNSPGVGNDDPFLTQDGLTMFYTSGGAGGADIWRATRPAVFAPWNPPSQFAPANSGFLDHSPLPEGNGEIVWFSSTRGGGAGGSTDFFMTTLDPVTGLYSAPVEIDDMNTADWDSNAWRGGVTGRMYVSQFLGPISRLMILCPRVVVVWIRRCVVSALIPVGIIWFPPPPRFIWRRVWLVHINVPQVRIEWYRWFRWPFGGLGALVASLGLQNPPIPASALLPGSEGGVLLNLGFSRTMNITIFPPNTPGGVEGFTLGIPPNPALIGLRLHLQQVGLDFGTNQLTVSEAGTLQIAP